MSQTFVQPYHVWFHRPVNDCYQGVIEAVNELDAMNQAKDLAIARFGPIAERYPPAPIVSPLTAEEQQDYYS